MSAIRSSAEERVMRQMIEQGLSKLCHPIILRMRDLRRIDPTLDQVCRRAYAGDKRAGRLAYIASKIIEQHRYERQLHETTDFVYVRRP